MQSDIAIENAVRFLQEQQRTGYPEAAHTMIFPRGYGFTGNADRHTGTVFQRAIVLDALLDAGLESVNLDEGLISADVQMLVDMRSSRAGWKYFPTLPELPPDADDLALAMQVLLKSRHPQTDALCIPAIEIIEKSAHEDGSFETWIVDFSTHAISRRFQKAIRAAWGSGCNVEVVANFLYSLYLLSKERFFPWIQRGAAWVKAKQNREGSWDGTWYFGPYWPTYVCIRLLSSVELDPSSLSKTASFLAMNVRENGGWGMGQATPLETALALLTLHHISKRLGKAELKQFEEQGVDLLLREQRPNGSWRGTDFIRMITNRARIQQGKETTSTVLTYRSDTITTALCLKALLMSNAAP